MNAHPTITARPDGDRVSRRQGQGGRPAATPEAEKASKAIDRASLEAMRGVKLIFPIFFCILPSLFVVTVGPVAMKIIRELVPMMQNI